VLGIVLELFVVEENLLAGGKHKVGAAVAAFEYSISKFHWPASPKQGGSPKSASDVQNRAGPGSLFPFVCHNKGPDRLSKKRFVKKSPR